jgi:hypothetical protein
MPGLAAKGKSVYGDWSIGEQLDTGQQAARYRLWWWKRFPVFGIPRAIGKPVVDDSTLTYKPDPD